MCYEMLKNSLSASSAAAVKRTNSAMSMFIETINYLNKNWDAIRGKILIRRAKAILGILLGNSFP